MSSYSKWAEIAYDFLFEAQLLFILPVRVFRRQVNCKITHNNPQFFGVVRFDPLEVTIILAEWLSKLGGPSVC